MKKKVGKRFSQQQRPSRKHVITAEKFLNQKEFDLLSSRLNDLPAKDSRNATIIFTALHTGARASEVLEIRKADLLEDQTVRIRGLKGSNDREVPVPDWLYQSLKIESKLSEHPQLIFPIGYQRLNQIWKSYRTCKKTFHSLRHTFALRIYEHTRDIQLVQRALGHRSLLNTLIYLHFVESKEGMRKVLIPADSVKRSIA